jgi:NmrA-like family
MTPRIFVIGGTGAQGLPIVEELAKGDKYKIRILTRDRNSRRAKDLAALGPNIEFLEGSFANESTLRTGYSNCDIAFVNIDGFNTGEKTEIYWGIRSYELALECGVQFFIWGNLDYVYKKSGYLPQFRTGHYDGKGRVGEWILQQNKTNSNRMKAALFTTGPYIDMAIASTTVMTPLMETDDHGNNVITWRVPLGDGAVPHVALSDCGMYVKWLVENQDRANGMDLETAICHVGYKELASAFTKVTGHKARYIDVSLEEFWKTGPIARSADVAAGYNADLQDPASMTLRQNFTGFWIMWKNSGGNHGVIQRDYKLLDEIFPGRIKSAEEWFRMEDERGRKSGEGGLLERVLKVTSGKGHKILKLNEDKRRGKL